MPKASSGFVAATVLWGAVLADADAQTPTSLPTPPNAVLLLMSECEESLAQDDFGAAVDALQQLLDLQEDYFDPRAEGRSIKRHAERTLRLLPPAGLQVYQRRYGPQAETLLSEAARADDVEKLNEVIRRFAMTEAGAAALELLADRLWDGGELLAAGRLFDRLINHPRLDDAQRAAVLVRSSICWWSSGNETRARDRLAAWSRLAAASEQISAAFPVASVDVHTALDWLEQLPSDEFTAQRDAGERIMSFRGDAQRSGILDRSTPAGGVIWSHPAMDEHDCWVAGRVDEVTRELDALEGRQRAERGGEHPLLPAGTPVIVGNRVVFRGYGMLKWLDPATGRFIWYGADRDETFKYLVEDDWRLGEEDWHRDNLELFLGQRAWRDLTSGMLSCDDRYVYSVFHSGIVSSMGATVQSIAGLAPHPLAPRPYNMLVAYEVDLCRAIWELGGPPGNGNELSGVFFHGPPLAMDGLLYCLIDDRKQVRLIVVDPAEDPAGGQRVVWEQSLYNPEHHLSSQLAAPRRLSGLTPSASGDVLVCPTGETSLVAVDRRTRRLLWSFQYTEVSVDPRTRQLAAIMARRPDPEDQILQDLLRDDHWSDSAPIISGESVLYTPPDHDELLCLRLTDGHLEWRADRLDGTYVAGIYDGNVIVVGASQVRALRIEDGEPAWAEPIPIPAPSGRGFQHGRFYVLPLSSGEIAGIDLADARILTRSPTARVPGNLFSVRGRIYSWTAAGLDAFASLDEQNRQIEERLALNPDDFEAIAMRGEQRLHLGDVSAGMQDLRRCLTLRDDPRVRELLASTLIEGLRVDFAAYRETAAEIDGLIQDPALRATFLRLLADGLQRSGDALAAFQTYLRFAGENINELVREGSEGQRLVRSDRWVRARMEDLYADADESSRAALEELMAASVSDAVRAREPDRLRDMLNMLPSSAQSERLRLALVDQLDPDESTTEVELNLLELLESADPDHRAAARARLLRLYLDESAQTPIPALAARLSGADADRVCLDGRTGSELIEEWASDEDYEALLHAADNWPLEDVEVDADSTGAQPQLYPVEHLGPVSMALRDWRFYVDNPGNSLLAYDDQGVDRWSVPIGQSGIRSRRPGYGHVRHVRTLGRLVLLVTDDTLFVLDALAADGETRVLVNKPLYLLDELENTFITRFQVQIGRGANPRAALRNQVRIANNQTSGNVGPLLAGGLVFQQAASSGASTIRAIHPLTGKDLWVRESPEVPAGAEIMADGESVVVWPPNRSHVIVLRGADGAFLSRSNLPDGVLNPQPDGDWGCCVVLVERDRLGDAGTKRLALFDPVSQTFRWEHEFENLVDWTVVDGRDFALLDDVGELTLIDGLTGDVRFSQTLNDPAAEEIFVERLHDQLLVTTASPQSPEKRVQPWTDYDFPIVHGRAALLSLEDGRIVWSRPLTHQTYIRHLPGRWPLLAFTANIFEPGREAGENYCSLLLLNRETGEPLHEQEWSRSINKYGWLSRPDRHRIELSFELMSVALEFSDSPPDSTEQNGAENDE